MCKPYSVDPLVSVPWAAVLIELDRELPCPFRTLAIGPQRFYRGQGADVGASHQASTGLVDGLMLMVSHLDATKFPPAGEAYFLQPFRPSPSRRGKLGRVQVTDHQHQTIRQPGERLMAGANVRSRPL